MRKPPKMMSNSSSVSPLSPTPAQVRGLAPEPGQHTEEKLLEMGHSWEDITSLKGEGAIL